MAEGAGFPLRHPIEQRRARAGSGGSRASGGAGGMSWGGRSSPEQSSQWRPELGFDGRASYRARGGKGEGGTEAGAHGGLEDVIGELGGGRTATCGRWRCTVAGDEDDEGGDDGGRPEVRGSTRRWRGSWRSSWTPLRGEGTAGSASVVSCSGGSASGAGRGRCPGEEGERERGEKDRGGAWRRSRASRRGGERQAGREGGGVAGGARARRHAAAWREGGKTTEEEAGWAACWLGRPAAAGLHREEPQVSFSFFYFCFLIF